MSLSSISADKRPDNHGFLPLDEPIYSCAWVTIVEKRDSVDVTFADTTESVWALKDGDTIQSKYGRFYIQQAEGGIQTFSQYFGMREVFQWMQFTQDTELVVVAVEWQVFKLTQ